MAKADICHAFRLCPVRPADWPLLCYTWDERLYVDLRLPFGACSSLFIFTQFAEALHWIAIHICGCIHVLHYLDDYFLARASHAACARDLQAFQDLCRDLGAPPSRQRSWSCRHALFRRCAASSLPARMADAAEMHQAGTAVADRHAFLRVQGGPSGPHFPPAAYRFVHDGPGLGAPHQPHCGGPHGHRVVGGVPAQLERVGFLPAAARHYSGTRVCYRRERRGAWHGFRLEMALRGVPPPPASRAYDINVLELLAVAVAVHCWGAEWHDTQILLHTHNMLVVQVWAMGTCKCPHIMSLVRRLFFFPCPAEREFASGACDWLQEY